MDASWRRLIRFVDCASVIAAIVAYAALVSMKTRGLTPPHLTWLMVLLGPLIGFSMLPIVMRFFRWRDPQ
jgi:hypothetical protein